MRSFLPFLIGTFAILSFPSCDPGHADPKDSSLSKTLITGLNLSVVDHVRIEDATESVSMKRLDTGWVLEGDLSLRAHHPGIRALLLSLNATDRGQTVDGGTEYLGELGLTPDSENYVKLTLNLPGEETPATFTFGDFNQPFDQTDASIIGERYTARRYVLDHRNNVVNLVDYPFHEVSPSYDDWYVHNVVNPPGRVRTFEVAYQDGSTRTISREKPFAFFDDSENRLDPEDQGILTIFLEEGFFPAIVKTEDQPFLKPIVATITLVDFNKRRYLIEVGQEKLIEKDTDDQFASGMIDVLGTNEEEKYPCRAVTYSVFEPNTSEPVETIEVFLEARELEPLLPNP